MGVLKVSLLTGTKVNTGADCVWFCIDCGREGMMESGVVSVASCGSRARTATTPSPAPSPYSLIASKPIWDGSVLRQWEHLPRVIFSSYATGKTKPELSLVSVFVVNWEADVLFLFVLVLLGIIVIVLCSFFTTRDSGCDEKGRFVESNVEILPELGGEDWCNELVIWWLLVKMLLSVGGDSIGSITGLTPVRGDSSITVIESKIRENLESLLSGA